VHGQLGLVRERVIEEREVAVEVATIVIGGAVVLIGRVERVAVVLYLEPPLGPASPPGTTIWRRGGCEGEVRAENE
jgi:hypothetical protein